MVYWSEQAVEDLEEIFDGLVNWCTANGQRHMEYSHALEYKDDLYRAFDSIDRLHYHAPARYAAHRRWGEYAHPYRRNRRTTWYGVYDRFGADCYLNRILSNYRTLSGTGGK